MDITAARDAQPLVVEIDSLNALIVLAQDAVARGGIVTDIKVKTPATTDPNDPAIILTPEQNFTLLPTNVGVEASKQVIELIVTMLQERLAAAELALAAL